MPYKFFSFFELAGWNVQKICVMFNSWKIFTSKLSFGTLTYLWTSDSKVSSIKYGLYVVCLMYYTTAISKQILLTIFKGFNVLLKRPKLWWLEGKVNWYNTRSKRLLYALLMFIHFEIYLIERGAGVISYLSEAR